MDWWDLSQWAAMFALAAGIVFKGGAKSNELDGHGERIRALETNMVALGEIVRANALSVAVVEERTMGMRTALERIEAKIDTISQPTLRQ